MKRYLMIAGVGIAFAAVSLWVWLSRGKSASAVRAKYRLGGILLSLSVAATTLTSCVSCYSPVAEPMNIITPKFDTSNAVYYSGDVLEFYEDTAYSHFKYVITSDKGDILYTGRAFGHHNIEVALAVGDYVGPITITFFGANGYTEEFKQIGEEFNCIIDAR
jgi:hypothetical protein